ncbi:hypothetical protein GCM10009085_42870 [Pseudomonas avellanae]|nr:hypothetical protein GCM10009085_42870 [Pseudomonas avellanae]
MAAFFGAVIRFGFDDAGGQPPFTHFVADDLAQQVAGEHLGITLKEMILKGRRHSQTVTLRRCPIITSATLIAAECVWIKGFVVSERD